MRLKTCSRTRRSPDDAPSVAKVSATAISWQPSLSRGAGVLSNHGNPVRLKAIAYPGKVSSPVHSAVKYDLNILVPLKGLEEMFVEIVQAPGDQDDPSGSRFSCLRVRQVRYRNQNEANLEPDR